MTVRTRLVSRRVGLVSNSKQTYRSSAPDVGVRIGLFMTDSPDAPFRDISSSPAVVGSSPGGAPMILHQKGSRNAGPTTFSKHQSRGAPPGMVVDDGPGLTGSGQSTLCRTIKPPYRTVSTAADPSRALCTVRRQGPRHWRACYLQPVRAQDDPRQRLPSPMGPCEEQRPTRTDRRPRTPRPCQHRQPEGPVPAAVRPSATAIASHRARSLEPKIMLFDGAASASTRINGSSTSLVSLTAGGASDARGDLRWRASPAGQTGYLHGRRRLIKDADPEACYAPSRTRQDPGQNSGAHSASGGRLPSHHPDRGPGARSARSSRMRQHRTAQQPVDSIRKGLGVQWAPNSTNPGWASSCSAAAAAAAALVGGSTPTAH